MKVDTIRGAVNLDFPLRTATDRANLSGLRRAKALGLSRLTQQTFHLGTAFIGGDFSVANVDGAVRMLRDIVLVRHQNDGVALLMQFLE